MQITKQIVLQVLVVFLQTLQEPRLLYSNAARYNLDDVVMVLREEREKPSMLVPVKPFTSGMWWTTAGFVIYTALVVWLLEQEKSRGEIFTREFFTRIWSAVSSMPCSLNLKMESKLAQIVIAIWLLVMYVIVSSYNANFTSMLHAQKVDVNELLASGVPIGYLKDHVRQDYLTRSLGIDPGNLKAYSTTEECVRALSKGPNRGGAAILMNRRDALYFRSGRPGYAIYDIPAQPEANTPRSLGVNDFLVWFIITGTMSTLALIKFFFVLLYRRRPQMSQKKDDDSTPYGSALPTFQDGSSEDELLRPSLPVSPETSPRTATR